MQHTDPRDVRESLAGDSRSPVIFLSCRFHYVGYSRADIRSALHLLCKACEGLRQTARAVLGDKLIWRSVSVVEHFDYAASLGVTTLPAVAINGRPAFLSLPTPEQFRRTLEHLVAQDSEAAVADFCTNATDSPSDPVAEPRLLI